jgi:hypothetical protein
MNQQQATAFVMRELAQGHSREEVVRALWEQTGWPRTHLEPFVQRVEAEQRGEIRAAVISPAPRDHQRPTEAAISPSPQPPQSPTKAVAPQAPGQPAHRVEAEPDEEVIQFVIGQLGEHRSRDEVVHTLCERQSWNWKQAERIVRRVEIEHHSKIAARQSPLVIGLGVGSVVVGATLIFYTAYLALNGEIGEYNPGIFITGVAMVLGGIAGIWRAVRLVRGLD